MNPKGNNKKKPVLDDMGNEYLRDIPENVDIKSAPPSSAPDINDIKEPTKNISGGQHDSLLAIKKQALAKLSNLVDDLEQTAEERFQTLLMIIQETDNISVIDKAYTTALEMQNPKERARALLAIAQEVNYFVEN